MDKYHPICTQPVVPRKKARLNHVSFNAHHPILIVGDSRGVIQCLKLSPNLRKQTKEVKTALINKDQKKALELEVKKLEVLLAMVRNFSIFQKISFKFSKIKNILNFSFFLKIGTWARCQPNSNSKGRGWRNLINKNNKTTNDIKKVPHKYVLPKKETSII